MKGVFHFICLGFLLLPGLRVQAQDTRNREALQAWLQGYRQYQAAAAAEDTGKTAEALHGFRRALTIFRSVQTRFPDWNPAALEMRIEECTARVDALRPKVKTGPPEDPAPTSEISTAELKIRLSEATQDAKLARDAIEQLRQLTADYQKLERDNEALRELLDKRWQAQPEAGRKELAEALTTIVEERREHEKTRQTLQTKLHQQTARNTTLRDELRELSVKQLRLQRQLLVHNRTVKQLKANAELAQQGLKRETAAHEKTHAENKALAENLVEAQKALDSIKKDFAAVQEAADSVVKARLAARTKRYLDLQKEWQQQNIAKARREAELKKLSQELDVLQAANLELRKQSQKDRDTALGPLVRELRETIQYQQLKQVEVEDQYQSLEKRCEALLATAEHMRKKLAAMDVDSAGKKQSALVTQLQKEVKLLRTEEQAATAAADRAEKQAARDRKLLEEALRQNASLKQELADYRGREAQRVENKALQERVEKLIAQAEQLLAAGADNQARGAYEQALALAPENVPALLGRARLHLESGEPTQATRVLWKAYRLEPEHPGLAALLGRAELAAGNPGQAVGLLQLARQTAPKDAVVAAELARALQAHGWLAAARHELEAAWELDSTRPETAMALAHISLRSRPPDVKNAKSWYSKARRLGLPADDKIERQLKSDSEP